MKNYLKYSISKWFELFALPFFFIAYFILIGLKKIKNKRAKPNLLWGADPLISNKYWSESLKQKGYVSKTLMNGFYSTINKKEDYDLYLNSLLPVKLPFNLIAYYAFLFAIWNFDIIHHPAHGFLLRFTHWAKKAEGKLLKLAGCKNVVLPYGSDIWMYSKISNTELRHAFLLSYPKAGKEEKQISRNIHYWIKNSSIFFPIHQTDGVGYWDILAYSYIVIDEKEWAYTANFNANKNGVNEVVKIIHSPNHRGVKGTEFIIQAVDNLKSEGLLVELILLEKVPNSKVKELMDEADILVEQLIIAHGLSALEGMAKGLTVISNFEDENRNKAFRTYSFLNECPIVSASTSDITDVLRKLVLNPQLRHQLGQAGRAYVEKYHSYKFGQYVFEQVYKKIWYGDEPDLMNMFHPLKSNSYNNLTPLIKHPLNKNKLPLI